MAGKKRPSKNKHHSGRHLSGNPQRRELQIAAREKPGAASDAPLDPPTGSVLRTLLGDPDPAPWWADAHARALERARELSASASPRELETATCEIVGNAFWDGVTGDEHGAGGHQEAWLRHMVAAAEREVRAGFDNGGWQPSWLLLQGITGWAPKVEPGTPGRDGYETALAATRRLAKLLIKRGLVTGDPKRLAAPAMPRSTGDPLVLCDVYGSRFALIAPFGITDLAGGPTTDTHWYCWDIDQCWLGELVGAGVFASPEDAAAEWRQAVGAAAVTDREPSPCTPEEVRELLAPVMRRGPLGDLRQGNEQRELIVELLRARRRAQELARHLGVRYTPEVATVEAELDDFSAWYAARHDAVPDRDDVATLAEQWGPHNCTAPMLYACSPHRITKATVLVSDGYLDEYVPGILGLLPEWVEWCIERSGLTGEPAERAREHARTMARVERPDGGWDELDDGPFRHAEL